MEKRLPKFAEYLRLLGGILLIFVAQNIEGQNADPPLPSIIPSSPNAAELGKYATLDVGLQTGTLNYKIPLFNIIAAGINIPINIQYSTSGIKVDQIASRCGMGWVLNAGGVVIRNLNDKKDEISTRAPLPSDWNAMGQDFLTYLQNITDPGSELDAEPDDFMFNFNGYSGRFVLDDNGLPVVMPYNNLKIVVSGSPDYAAVRITTPDGCVYHFTAAEFTSNLAVCYGSPTQPVPPLSTAWYLTEIELPNSETVTFSYDDCLFSYYSGISQVISRSDDQANTDNPCSTCNVFNQESFCANALESAGKVLRSISYRSTIVSFNYIDRLDLKPPDDPHFTGEKLLSRITIFNGNDSIKSYAFNYETSIANTAYQSIYGTYPELKYRPFLKSLSEKDNTGGPVKEHQFMYNDINGMPPRLSFAQDLWGYFNGMYNMGFVPRPELAFEQQLFPNATADRNPNLESALKGALIKIIYPTGGSDSIIYELNDYKYGYLLPPPTATKSLNISPRPDYPYSVSSTPFTPYSSQNIRLVGGIIQATDPNGSSNIDPNADVLDVEVIRQGDNQNVYGRIVKASEHLDEVLTGLSTSDSYVLRITSLYPNIKCAVGVTYETGPAQTTYINKNVGGLRVAKIIQDDNRTKNIKRYIYAYTDSLSVSSGNIGPLFKNIIAGNYMVSCQQNPVGDSPGILSYYKCKKWTAYSSSLVNLYSYGQNHIYYSSVIESDGNNFENGGVAHSYILDADHLSKPLWGVNLVLGLKTSNTGILNGLEKQQLFFRKNGNAFIPVKRVANSYKVDTRVNKVVDAYLIKKNYDYIGPESNPPIGDQFEAYEVNKYGFYSKWAYMDTSTVFSYDTAGESYIAEKTVYQYDNLSNISISKTEKNNSKSQTVRTKYLYPNDMVSAGADPSGVYQQMVNKNIINPVTDEATFLINGTSTLPVNRIINNYWNPVGAVYAIKSVAVQHASDPVDTLLKMNKYDAYGNILEQQNANDVKEVYLWGYNSQYPVVKVVGSDYITVTAQIANLQAQINTATATANNDAGVRSLLGGLRAAFANNKSVQVFTYTYKPLIGMTSETDPTGRTVYYEYDNFGRLNKVKDDQGNIIKHICYNYAGQVINCNQ